MNRDESKKKTARVQVSFFFRKKREKKKYHCDEQKQKNLDLRNLRKKKTMKNKVARCTAAPFSDLPCSAFLCVKFEVYIYASFTQRST